MDVDRQTHKQMTRERWRRYCPCWQCSSCLNSQGGWSQERSAVLALVLSGSLPQSCLVFIHVSRFGSRPSLLKILGPSY